MEIVIYILCAILAVAGLAIMLVSLPGEWLIFLASLIAGINNGFEDITILALVVIFVITICSSLIDNVIVALGAKKLGGSIWGMIGAILGGFVGFLIGNILGFILGPVIGATLFELIFAKQDFKHSLKAGIGSFIGIFLSIVIKLSINVAIVIYIVSRVV